jgi:hypothetical protein
MEAPLRPELGRILPRPLLRQPRQQQPPLGPALQVPASGRDDFLVEVDRRRAGDATAAGFDLGQATAIAARIAGWLRPDQSTGPSGGSRPPDPRLPVHRLDAERVRGLLATR